MKKNIFSLLNIFLIILIIFCTININSYATNDQQSIIDLYGFGDDYDDDDFLTLHNTRTCYVRLKNIPFSEKTNINLTVKDEDIAEIKEIVYGDDSNPVITAQIKGKKIGTTDIIASLTYNGVNYTSKITTTVHESNYRIEVYRESMTNINVNSIKKNERVKLIAELFAGMATRVGDISSNGVIWSSNNENVAIVDSSGLVTGIGKGIATITAEYETNEGVTISDFCNIEVKDENNSLEKTGIRFDYDDPGPSMTLNREEKFNVELYNIPETEKGNIKFKIEDESIAKITKTEYDNSRADAIATIKYLSVGKTKLIATLEYNGNTYSDSCELDVIEEEYYLDLFVKKSTSNNLPSSLRIGDKIQLYGELRNKRGMLVPPYTESKIVWTSSNENVVNVDDTGLVTAIGEGTANIIAQYIDEYKTVTTKYELKIIDPTQSPVNPGTTNNSTTSPTILPKTGKNAIILIIGIALVLLISVILHKKSKIYKDIK